MYMHHTITSPKPDSDNNFGARPDFFYHMDTKEIQKDAIMPKVMAETPPPPEISELVTGIVIAIEPGAVYVDLPPFGTGIIFGREYINARDIIKNISHGDEVTATVTDLSGEEGYIELSLKEARQAILWSEAEQALAAKTVFDLPITDANKGGLIIEWQGIQGFLPASQLKPEHYPRVEGGDKDKIFEELARLVGTSFSVSIIGVNPKEGKLIFSEKGHDEEDTEKIVRKYDVGDIVEGEITGIVDFGVFIKVEEKLEGLAHISELDWGLVENPHNLFSVGEKVKAKIIEIKDGQISLSVKQLKPNPWHEAASRYKTEDVVDGVVIKYNKHGALASIEEGVAGLVHISEFESPENLRTTLELGKTYQFKINLFEPREQRMTLSYLGAK